MILVMEQAERLIPAAKTKAESESTEILQKGEKKLVEIQQNIDINFDSAVKDSVSTIMKV